MNAFFSHDVCICLCRVFTARDLEENLWLLMAYV